MGSRESRRGFAFPVPSSERGIPRHGARTTFKQPSSDVSRLRGFGDYSILDFANTIDGNSRDGADVSRLRATCQNT